MKNNDNFFLRNTWYYALPSNQIKPGMMISRIFLGEPVLLVRDRDGKVSAMRDICPHRAVPLSCGKFNGQEVECCYHGWRFNFDGRCTAIPSLVEEQQMDLSRFDVQSYAVREAQGNIWIYMTDPDNPQPASEMEIPVIPGFDERSLRGASLRDAARTPTHQFVEVVKFPCFVDHAVVGLMDPAHSPYVHRAWWWRNEQLHEEVKQFDASPYGFTMRRHRLPANGGRLYWLIGGGVPETEISFRLPGVRIEETTINNHRVVNLTAVTPISDTETEVTFALYWTLPWVGFFKPLMHVLVRTFIGQDRTVVEKQQIGLQYNPVLRLIKDSDMQAQWYYQLKREYARSVAEGREFVNPVKGQILRWRA